MIADRRRDLRRQQRWIDARATAIGHAEETLLARARAMAGAVTAAGRARGTAAVAAAKNRHDQA
jgi:aldehyde:ferredoxin oxidoreductase